MTAAALTIAILRLQGLPLIPGAAETRARLLAPIVLSEAAARNLDPVLLAAVAWHESRFDRHARGLAGELGYMQIRRDTRATKGYDHLSDNALINPGLNFHLGARHLAHVRDVCLDKTGVRDPLAWLSVYSGLHCRPSRYSRAIMADVERVSKESLTVPPAIEDHHRKLDAPARPERTRVAEEPVTIHTNGALTHAKGTP